MPRGTSVAVEARLSSALQSINFDRLDLSGQTIGLTVGSRGISHLADIVRHLSARIRDRGARTVIIPAMGSHGGGRLSGPRDVLAEMGVTETSCGASIIDGTSTVVSGRDAHGEPVYTISGALQCDGVVVLNRIKAHTDFEGGIESGILKMLAVGLGGPAGAAAVHERGTCQGLERAIRDTARVILERLNIVFAVGVIENGLGETVRVEAMGPSEIEQREPALLIEAKALSPRLPFDRLEVLLIDEIGKNISGTMAPWM